MNLPEPDDDFPTPTRPDPGLYRERRDWSGVVYAVGVGVLVLVVWLVEGGVI